LGYNAKRPTGKVVSIKNQTQSPTAQKTSGITHIPRVQPIHYVCEKLKLHFFEGIIINSLAS
jgi:hypothetical protein